MKRLASRRQQAARDDLETRGERELEKMSGAWSEVTMEELREFLAADVLDVRADPGFKERLREELWELVRSRARPPSARRDGPDDSAE